VSEGGKEKEEKGEGSGNEGAERKEEITVDSTEKP